MQSSFQSHASEETLEGYSQGTLGEAELAAFEEHLLVCPLCQDRLAETDAFIRAMREAAQDLQAGPPVGAGLLAKMNLPSRIWAPVLAGLAVALGVLGWWNLGRGAGGPPVAVALQSVRGGEDLPGAQAPSGRPLLLRLDLTGIPGSASYKLEVVNAQGRTVRGTSLHHTGASPEVTLTKLEPGQYWVRLYSQPQGELLREFGLRVK